MTGSSIAEPFLWGTHFELPGGAHALFTNRAQGNLSTVTGPGSEDGALARSSMRTGLGLDGLCNGRQVHGTAVRTLRLRPGEGLESRGPEGGATVPEDGSVALEADGHATALLGVGVMVLVADCLPVVLACESAVAAVHAGWRGLAGGVLEQGVRSLCELAPEQAEIVAVIGPCAGSCCYEVGREVHEALGEAHPRGRLLDLRAIACERLAAAGVARVEHLERCTICDPELFSHRREGAGAGRQAGLAWLS